MKGKLLSAILLLVMLLGSAAYGSVVGKITGTVTDSETGDPIVGATITVEGSLMGAIANADGGYTILNVPVGDYTLAVSAVGFSKLVISNVHVSADLASYQDPKMTKETTELGTVIQVTAETPMIVRDKTTTINVVKREELLAMPTRGFEQVVGIQNSVVRMNSGNFGQRQRGQRASQASNQELNLRGGRPSEVAYYVDGFSQQDPLTGLSTASINNNAIKEVSVQSGAFSAEYGHVASGVVNVITNEGTDEYHGNVEVVTDQVLSDNFDHNYYSADVSGPLPSLENAYFFLSGERRYLGDRTPSGKTEEMLTKYGKTFGLDTLYGEDPQRLPQYTLSGWSYQGKLRFDLNQDLKLTLSGNGSVDYWREYRQEWLLNPEHGPRYEDKNLGLNAKINHVLNDNTFWNLSVSYFTTSRQRGDNEIFDDYAAYERFYVWDTSEVDDIVNPEYDDYSLFWTPSEDITVISNNDDTVSVAMPSYYAGFQKRKSAYIGFKGDLTSHMHDYHTVKVGFDLQLHTLRYFQNLDATKGYNAEKNTRVNRYGYDEQGNEASVGGDINNVKKPYNLGMYLQDRFEWRGVIVQAGLRFDMFDYQSKRLKDLELPFGEDRSTLDPEDLEDSKTFYRVSPRLGISFPISDKTQMHINYGKFFQRPDLQRLYVGYDFLQARVTAGSYYPFPSPNLEPEKTTQYEVGLNHRLGQNVAFEITAYYKDVQNLTQILHQEAVPKAYDFFANIDYGTIKGVDFSINMRRTRNIRLDLKYSLSYATGTGSYAQSTYSLNWSGKEPPKTTNPLDYDQRHNFTGLLDIRTGAQEGPKLGEIFPLENMSLNVIFYAGSGTPYTPSWIYDEATENAVRPLPIGTVNDATRPWVFNIDLKLERKFKLAEKYDITPYFWVKNLLDRENVVGVYEGTGKPDVTGWLQTDVGQTAVSNSAAEGTDYKERYELKSFNSTNWSNPRQILFGMRVSF